MSNHVTEWLNAYLDAELEAGRLQEVKSHLAECRQCQADLQSLQDLSSLLRQVPLPEFMPSERFAAQVGLRLPRELPRAPKRLLVGNAWRIRAPQRKRPEMGGAYGNLYEKRAAPDHLAGIDCHGVSGLDCALVVAAHASG